VCHDYDYDGGPIFLGCRAVVLERELYIVLFQANIIDAIFVTSLNFAVQIKSVE